MISSTTAERQEVAGDAMQPTLHKVVRTKKETHDTFTMELRPVGGAARKPFAPGQFNMVYVFGAGECAISISGSPAAPQTLLHTTRIVGTVTRALRNLKEGDQIGIRGPFGSAWPLERAAGCDVVLIAGGIGLAPLRPAICQILAEREKYGKIVLLYGARTPQDLLYRRELEHWRAKLDLEVQVTVDRADPGWRGNVGVVTTLVRRAPFDRLNAVAFVCGPEIMMRYAVAELQTRGVPNEQIFISMERNMKCAVGVCGHCQFGPMFVCKDGPVFGFDRVRHWFEQREI
jgi:NAD(P)H-flavin reductase